MKLAIITSTDEPETSFNALRLGCYALGQKDEVGVFLLGKGVELDRIDVPNFPVKVQAQSLLEAG